MFDDSTAGRDPAGYWWATDRRISDETFHDRRAAAAMAADQRTADAQPFGTARPEGATA